MFKSIMRLMMLVVMVVSTWSVPVMAIELQDMQGKPRALSDYTGKSKWLIVMFWVSDCLICNKEAKQYEQFHQQHKNKDASMLGISLDGPENLADAKKFIQDHKLTFPNLVGEAQQVALLYMDNTGQHWVGTPTFLLFNPQGQLKAEQSGAVPVKLLEDFIQANRQ